MLSFFGRSTKGKPVVIADVEGSSAAVAVALLHGDKQVEILVSERQAIPNSGSDPSTVSASIPTVLKEVSERVLKKYTEQDGIKKYGAPKAVHATLGSPWAHARTARAETSFPEARSISKQAIQALAQEAIKQPSDLQQPILETNVMRVHINGYPTAKPVGKKGKELAATIFQSDAAQQPKQAIESALSAQFPGRAIDVRSGVRALMSVINERAHEHNYFVLLVGSESTECIAIRKEAIAEHATVPEGMNTIIRRIAGEKGLPEEKTTLLRMLASDTCSAEECEVLKQGLAKAEPDLTKLFGDVFGKLAALRRLPNTCILFAHADLSPWLEHFFNRLDFSQFTVTTQPFVVQPVTQEHMQSFVSWQAGVRQDTGIGIAAAFASLGMKGDDS
ncbi:hypothetical protein HY969_02375 [Candidatus Kaiserbacteria bacterium]|nr:hypothetical protein [Candidatus Kaiserbacteria bacterium]